jgi:hypothetical protein
VVTSKPTASAWVWALSRQASRARRARVKAGTVASKRGGFMEVSGGECNHRMFLMWTEVIIQMVITAVLFVLLGFVYLYFCNNAC